MHHADFTTNHDLEMSDPLGNRAQYQPLKDAIDALASVCDGARERDDVGFNVPDASLGHLLAFLPLALWPPEAFFRAWEMLRKYQEQLAFHGITYTHLPTPARPQDRAQGMQYITLAATGEFLVLFDADARLERAFARLPGGEKKTAPARYHLVYPVPGAGRPLLAFAERHGFVWAPHVEVQARLIDYQVLLEEQGVFSVYFPCDEEMNAEIKAIPGWWYAYRPHFHWLIPSNPDSIQAFQAFLVRHPEFQMSPGVEQRLHETSAHHKLDAVAEKRGM